MPLISRVTDGVGRLRVDRAYCLGWTEPDQRAEGRDALGEPGHV
ncbi:hypothetical protein [Kitasatospora sp. NPDC054795]